MGHDTPPTSTIPGGIVGSPRLSACRRNAGVALSPQMAPAMRALELAAATPTAALALGRAARRTEYPGTSPCRAPACGTGRSGCSAGSRRIRSGAGVTHEEENHMDKKDARKGSTGTYRIRRVSRDLHRAARLRATGEATTLRWVVLQALQAYSAGTWSPSHAREGGRP